MLEQRDVLAATRRTHLRMRAGDLPGAVELPASSGATQDAQASVLRSKGMEVAEGGQEVVGVLELLCQLSVRWQRQLMLTAYLSMVIASLLWHLKSDHAQLVERMEM